MLPKQIRDNIIKHNRKDLKDKNDMRQHKGNE